LALRSIRTALVDVVQALVRFVPEGRRRSLDDVIKNIRHYARSASGFKGFQQPYSHFSAQEYEDLANENGFGVLHTGLEDRAWAFQTREAFVAFSPGDVGRVDASFARERLSGIHR
jgi:hypothetical protein